VLLRAVRPAIGVWAALVVGGLHELVDYHFEVPGIAALALVCVAVVVSGRASSRSSPEAADGATARWAAFAAAAGSLAAVALAQPALGHTLAEDRRLLSALAIDKGATGSHFREVARESLLRYPAEPFLPLMGAVRAQVNGEGGVVPWVARALERSPRFGRAHFVLAQSLGAAHAAQARLEYRLAYENDEGLRDAIVKQAVNVVEDAETALELAPDGRAGLPMLEALVAALADRLPSTAVLLDDEIERRAPDAVGPLRRRAEAAASDAVHDAPWCAPDKECTRRALESAREIVRREPTVCGAHARVARLRASLGRGEVTPALDDLQRAVDTVTDRSACQRQLIQLAFESGESRRGDMALERLVRSGCGATADCLDLYAWAAGMEEGRGHYLRAARLYRKVIDLSPDRDDLLERIGALGERDGVLAEALDAYATLAARHPSEPRWPARIAELRARATPPRGVGVPGLPSAPGP
jgi:tetratricopeptide (TPR) repeat protein